MVIEHPDTNSSKIVTCVVAITATCMWRTRRREEGRKFYLIVFGNEQEHDRASSSSKSSVLTEKSKATQKLASKSLERSLAQQKDFKSSEYLTSPKKTDYGDQSNKPVDNVGDVIDEATLLNLNSPSPASFIKKSNTMSNGPAPRHRNTLGRTSVSKSLKFGELIIFLVNYAFITFLKLIKTFSFIFKIYFHLVAFL